jgi:hypothetical protein
MPIQFEERGTVAWIGLSSNGQVPEGSVRVSILRLANLCRLILPRATSQMLETCVSDGFERFQELSEIRPSRIHSSMIRRVK